MKKAVFLLLGVIFFNSYVYSQQLYVSNIQVRDCGGGTNDLSLNPYPSIEFDDGRTTYPGGCLRLCAWITAVVKTNADHYMGVDDLTFEIFKFRPGTNPLDPSSSPPIRTIPLYNITTFYMGTTATITQGPFCAEWDGSYNVEGFWGKTNGFYGFRVTVRTNEVSPTAGNINIQQTSAFPGQDQYPIKVDVVNIHVVKVTPTVVGKIAGVGAQPYNILYRLSKDANVTITIENPPGNVIRTIINNLPRFGEGIPDGTLTNGDYWDGRDDNGLLVQPTTYYYRIRAGARDSVGWDQANDYIGNISIEPLQITDVSVKDLGPLATDVAIISFMLTEDATTYLDIYPPGTQFGNINCANRSTNCNPTLNGNPVNPLRSYIDTKPRRQTVSFYWDGKDNNGNYLCDGQYVFALSAETPGRGGMVRTQRLSVGTVSIAKGDPLAFLNPSSTVIGSSPTAAGLNPFYFRFQLQRPADVRLEIRNMSNALIRTLLPDNGPINIYEPLSSGIQHTVLWDGKNSNGSWVSSGTYRANLIIRDPHVCATNNTFTHSADFNVNLFRVVDVTPQHIIGMSTTAAISYQLSQSMWVDLKIYRPEVGEINPSAFPWNSGVYVSSQNIVYSVSGIRPARYKITEYWDGRDEDGWLVEDGKYPFTLVAYTTNTATPIYASDRVYGYIDVAKGKIAFLTFNITPDIAQTQNSSEVVKLPPHMIEYSLSRHAAVTITVTDFYNGKVVAKLADEAARDPMITYKDFWDGRCFQPESTTTCKNGDWMIGDPKNKPLYNINVYARDLYANPNKPVQVTTITQTVENYPFRLYDLAIAPLTPDSPAQISYQLSETMKVSIKIYKPGTRFIGTEPVCPGSSDEEGCLVKKIIGTRPKRTLIKEIWNGTDEYDVKVAPGNYVLKIIGTYKPDLIDNYSGNCTDTYNSCNVLENSNMLFSVPVLNNNIKVKSINVIYNDEIEYPVNINYEIDSKAFVYLDIYPQNVTFVSDCSTRSIACVLNNFSRISSIEKQSDGNILYNIKWDSKDSSNNYLCDGNYIVALTAANNYGIWTNNISTGLISINKGNIVKEFSIIPYITVDNNFLPPIHFGLELKRPSKVSFRILNKYGNVVKTIYLNQDFAKGKHTIVWDGKNNDSMIVPKGEYIAELVTLDNFTCEENKISTHTINFNFKPFGLYNLSVGGLSVSSPSVISYYISQPMVVVTKIYKVYNNNDIRLENLPRCKDSEDNNCLVKVLISSGNLAGKYISIFDYPYINTNRYVYKIFASTDINEIDESGNCIGECKSLIDEVLVGEIPVERIFKDNLDISVVKDVYSKDNYLIYSFNLRQEANIDFEVYNSSHQKVYGKKLVRVFGNQNNYFWNFEISNDVYLDEGNYYLKLIAQNNGKFDIITSTYFYFNPYHIYDFKTSSNTLENPVRFEFKTFTFSNIFYEIVDENNMIVYKELISNRKVFDLLWNGRDLNGLRLKNGNYKLRLYVFSTDCKTSDINNCILKYYLENKFTLEREEITIIDSKISVNEDKEILVVMPDKEIKIKVLPQTFSQDVNLQISTSSLEKIKGVFDETVIPLNFTFEIKNDRGEQPRKPVKFYIDYNDSEFAGVDESKLVITRYVPENGRWVILKSKVYPQINRLEAETDHFSIFNVSSLVPANSLANIRIYPNPFNPIKHFSGMKFSGLPNNCEIKIFSITGELVKHILCDGSGFAIWDGKSNKNSMVGSGVYIVYISSDLGEKKTKIIVEK